MYTEILGFRVFNEGIYELLDEIEKREKVNIVSGNPQVLYNGLIYPQLNKNFKEEYSIIIPDGVGTVLASKIVKNPVKEKIAGIELMDQILKKCVNEEKKVYLVGSTDDVLKECILKLIEKYHTINIIGSHNGFFNADEEKEIVEDIIKTEAYAVFVALGSPKQEKFIEDHINELPCKIIMGVGGSFDVIAGKVKRAPRWMVTIGLEWLYRTIKEPFRIKRLFVIPKFLWKVIRSK